MISHFPVSTFHPLSRSSHRICAKRPLFDEHGMLIGRTAEVAQSDRAIREATLIE